MLTEATEARAPESHNRERPILFSGPMVRALLDGRKTQTRRVVKVQPSAEAVDAGVLRTSNPRDDGLWFWLDSKDLLDASVVGDEFRCPYGVPGDRLWVRETFKATAGADCEDLVEYAADKATRGHENTAEAADRWLNVYHYGKRRGANVPGIHMPRWASRLTLGIPDIRVERLQAITEADAIAEGVFPAAVYGGKVESWLPAENLRDRFYPTAREAYQALWTHINGPDAWAKDPFVWVVGLEPVR